MTASLEGNEEIVQLLLFHPRIDANKVDLQGKTALSMACENDRTNISKILLSCPATDTNLLDENNRANIAIHFGFLANCGPKITK